MKYRIGDIVGFNWSDVDAISFCHERNITGFIEEIDSTEMYTLISVVVGFGYKVFVKPEDIRLIAKCHELPGVENEDISL